MVGCYAVCYVLKDSLQEVEGTDHEAELYEHLDHLSQSQKEELKNFLNKEVSYDY